MVASETTEARTSRRHYRPQGTAKAAEVALLSTRPGEDRI